MCSCMVGKTASVKVGKSGSVRVLAYLSDGVSISVTTRLMIADIGGEEVAELAWNGKTLKAAKDSGVTIRYTKSTGMFNGTIKVDVLNAKGRMERKAVFFRGVFLDGCGYGVTTSKVYAGVPVIIEAN